MGSIVGVGIAVHVLMPLVGVKTTLIAGCAIDVGLGMALLALAAPQVSWPTRWPAFAGVVALLFFADTVQTDPRRVAAGVFRTGAARIPDSNLVLYHHDGKTATVDIVENEKNRSIRSNGKPDAAIAVKPASRPQPMNTTCCCSRFLPLGYMPQARPRR